MTAEAEDTKPKQPTIDWLKAMWWARGIVSAFSLVALLDLLGIARTGWLPIVHAVATQWADGLHWLQAKLNLVLPFKLSYSRLELVGLIWAVALLIPSIAVMAYGERKTFRGKMAFLTAIFFCGFCVWLAWPIDFAGTLANGNQAQRNIFLMLTGTMVVCTLVSMIVLWMNAQAYVRAILIVLSFIATLELFYAVPFINDALKPFVEQLSVSSAAPADAS